MVHKHDATRLHYDLRLEIDGALASWAVPKGPSYDPAERRLAVETEDHPLEYGQFEGRIPDGEYGAGDSIIWDRGTWETVPPGEAAEQRRRGHLELVLDGEKLRGRWHLVRTGGRGAKRPAWLLWKARDAEARPGYDVVAARPESVGTGRRVTRGPARVRTLRAVHPEPEVLLARVGPPRRGRLLAALSGGRVAVAGRADAPPAVRSALARLVVGEVVLDGSLDGGALAARDLLWLEGEDLRARPASERRELVESLLSHAGPALVVAPAPARARPSAPAPSKAAVPTVALTHPERLLYPAAGLTKADLAAYYDALSGPLVAALAGRPLALEHYPSGIGRRSFFHQNIERGAPSWLTITETPSAHSTRGRSTVRHLVVDRPEALRWLAQRAAITIHCWASRVPTLGMPDYVVFDLDPAEGETIAQAIPVALGLRRLLEELGLPSVPKTSGSRGLHVYVPLAPGHTHEDAVEFAVAIGGALTRAFPQTTMERATRRRRGRLYIDCHQNGWGKTIVAPYSPRATPEATVAAPLRWSEISARLDPGQFTIRTMVRRVARLGDLFSDGMARGVRLPRFR